MILDFLTIICGFVGYGLNNDDVARYFKAIRALRLLFIIKEIKILNEPANSLMTALAKVGNVLIPALLIIYIYAVVGLYTFAGNFIFIKISNTVSAELLIMSTKLRIGLFMRIKFSSAVKDPVLLLMENNSSVSILLIMTLLPTKRNWSTWTREMDSFGTQIFSMPFSQPSSKHS